MAQTTESFPSDLESQIENARKGVQYFESLYGASQAMVDLVKFQKDLAQKVFDELSAELIKRESDV